MRNTVSGIQRVNSQGEWKEDEGSWCKIWQLFYDFRTLLCSPNLPRPLLFQEPDVYRIRQDFFSRVQSDFWEFHVSHSMVDVCHSSMKQLLVTHCSNFLRCETVPDTNHVSKMLKSSYPLSRSPFPLFLTESVLHS